MCANIWNPATCTCEYGPYLGSITDDSVVPCDEIINPAGSVSKIVLKSKIQNGFLCPCTQFY